MNSSDLNLIGSEIIASAFEVRKELGPFFVEKIYEESMWLDLQSKGFSVKCQQSFPVYYKGQKLNFVPTCDILVENEIIIELKAVPFLEYNHVKQLISYLHVSGKKLGYLINFHSPNFRVARSINSHRDNLGIYRYAHNL